MATLPTPNDPATQGTWGAMLNAYLDENFTAIRTSLDALTANLPSTTLSVNVSGNTIVLAWTGVTGATGYLVGRDGVDQYGTQGSTVFVEPNVASKEFANLSYGTEYTFTVQPVPGRATTVKATTTAAPTGSADTTLSVQGGDAQATVTWTPVTGATGYLVGRDGTDNGGTGPWSTIDPPSATSRSFLSLLNGTLYTIYVEPQGTGKPAYPTTGHGRKTITVTPAAAAPPAGQTVVSTGTITNTSIQLNWTAVSGATGYLVGRNGVDASGSGAFQTTIPAGTLTYTFSNLVSGNGYTLFCTPQPGGQKKEITTATTVTTTDPGTPPTGSGTSWLSGWSGGTDNATLRAQAATFRGEPLEYQRRWFDGPNLLAVGSYMQSDYTSQGYTGWVDLAIGGPGGSRPSWAQSASGAFDATWRTQCQQIHANWGNLAGVTLSMAHELNGNWYEWSVTAASAPYFRDAWKRFSAIVQTELKDKGRNVKTCLNYGAGQNNVEVIWPGNAYVDVVGVDIYDAFQPTPTGNIRTQADWDGYVNRTTGDGSPWGPGAWTTFATAKGKPLLYPEWGISPSPSYDFDNPFWIQKMYDYFKSIAPASKTNPAAGKLLGEMYFMAGGWTSTIWPNTSAKPLSAAKMQALKWGSTL